MSASTWSLLEDIFLVSGGLGLFMYGMTMMSDGLENMAGNRMRVILERATSNRLIGIVVGAVVTCIIQSSSATTVMVVGFVNAGLMTLMQAMGVIMGATIGTTITAQIISFKIDPIAPFIIFIGMVMFMFFKKRSVKNTGYILLGFGVLFFGISVMGATLKTLAKTPGFSALLTTSRNPVLALLAGTIFTAIIQSSSATTGIVVTLYLGGVALPFQTAVFIVLGSNIGTCITAILASISTNRESKQAALAHVIIKIIGCVVFGSIIIIFPGILVWIQTTWPDGARQIAMFHTLFNCANVLLMYPFTNQLVELIQKVIPEHADDSAQKRLVYLTPSILQTPTGAVMNALSELYRMGIMVVDNLSLALESFYESDTEKAEKVINVEEIIDYLNNEITAWLIRIQGINISMADREKLSNMFHTLTDLERIGDHAENIAEFAIIKQEQNAIISPAAIEELRVLSDSAMQMVTLALEALIHNDETKLPQVDSLEVQVDAVAVECVENHIKRLMDEVCDPRGGVIFTDMITNLERCADHANNIAFSIINAPL